MDNDTLFFFGEHMDALPIYERLENAILTRIPDVKIKVAKTQITFAKRYGFAFVSFNPCRKAKDRPAVWMTVTFGLGYQCHPSYATIGRAIHMSSNTVRKYVSSLVEKRLIYTEPTSIITKKGEKRNGSLLYTIRPIQDAVDLMREQERENAEQEFARQKLEKLRVS